MLQDSNVVPKPEIPSDFVGWLDPIGFFDLGQQKEHRHLCLCFMLQEKECHFYVFGNKNKVHRQNIYLNCPA
jgi:hypothetical protein